MLSHECMWVWVCGVMRALPRTTLLNAPQSRHVHTQKKSAYKRIHAVHDPPACASSQKFSTNLAAVIHTQKQSGWQSCMLARPAHWGRTAAPCIESGRGADTTHARAGAACLFAHSRTRPRPCRVCLPPPAPVLRVWRLHNRSTNIASKAGPAETESERSTDSTTWGG